jgi:hypothetical protein
MTKSEITHFNSSGNLYTLHGILAIAQPSSMMAYVDLYHQRLGHLKVLLCHLYLVKFLFLVKYMFTIIQFMSRVRKENMCVFPLAPLVPLAPFHLSCYIVTYGRRR